MFDFLIPLAIALSMSVRPAVNSDVMDYLARVQANYKYETYRLEYEREEGDCYLNYAAYGKRSTGDTYYVEYSTNVIESKRIDRQIVTFARDVFLLGVGGTATTHKYSKLRGAINLSCPLPGGEVKWITNALNVHIWDIDTRMFFTKKDNLVRPYIEAHFLSDNGDRYYRCEVGLEITLRSE